MNVRKIVYDRGRADALELQSRAPGLDGTALIREEEKIPAFDPGKDYSLWGRGLPVREGGQVWTLLQPHNAAHYPGSPSALRALWGLAHTRDPERAKPWVEPLGTSGMYMTGECYREEDGRVWRCRWDNTVHSAAAWPEGWEEVL